MDRLAARGGDEQIIAAMAALGATSPITACRHRALPPIIRDQLQALLDRGIVREGRPGHYYLYAPQRGGSFQPRMSVGRILFAAGFWIFIILLPLLFIYVLAQ